MNHDDYHTTEDYHTTDGASRPENHKTDYPMLLFPGLAKVLGGSDEAAFVSQTHYWTCRSGHIRPEDGQRWIWNSIPNWLQQFSWLSEKTLKRIISKLEKLGILLSEQFQRQSWNQTKWYRLNYEKLAEIGWNPCSFRLGQNDLINSYFLKLTRGSKWPDRGGQNGLIEGVILTQSSLLTETTSEITSETLSPPTPSQEKERENEQKCLEQEKEGEQGDGMPEGTSTPQSPTSPRDQSKVDAKPKDSKLDQPSGGGANLLQKTTDVLREWEIAPGEPYPDFIKWRSQHYIAQGGRWAAAAEANARSEIRKSPDRGEDLWKEFLKYADRAADSALAHKAAGMNPTLPPCFQESPDPIKEDVAAKLAAIAPTRNPTAAPGAIAPSAAAPVGCNPTPVPGATIPSTVPDDAEDPQAYKLFKSEIPEDYLTLDELQAKTKELIGKRSMSPMPKTNDEPSMPIFTTPPTLAEAREKWAALPEHREQIKKEIANHPHWDLEVVDGCIEIPF